MLFNTKYDVLVIGGGIIGVAVLHALTLRGMRVGLAERGLLAQGCTAYSGGIVRVFHTNPYLSELAAASYPVLRDFEAHVGESCAFTQTGFMYFPSMHEESSAREQVTQLAPRIPMEWWEAERVRSVYPLICTNSPAVHEPGAGYMVPSEVARAFGRSARRLGASIHEGTAVERLVRAGGRFVGVETSHGLLLADRLVLALGPNTPRFLDQHQISHELWAQRIQVDIRKSSVPRGTHPAWIDDINSLNGRPHENDGFLIGYPTHDRRYHDGPVQGSYSHSSVIESIGRNRFKWLETTERQGSYSSFDCYSDGAVGIADFVDDARSLAVITGFSGGAFKLAPELARRVSNLLTGN